MTARGAALPVTLLVLSVTGSLAAGLVWVAMLEARSGRNALAIVQAHAAAETGAFRAIREAPRTALEALPPGDALPVAGTLGPAGSYAGAVRALGSGVYAVTVHGYGPGRFGRQTAVILAILGDSAGLRPMPQRSWVWAP